MEHQQIKHAMDIGAGAIVLFSWTNWLPPIATALSILWLCVQFYEYFRKKCNKRKSYKRRSTD